MNKPHIHILHARRLAAGTALGAALLLAGCQTTSAQAGPAALPVPAYARTAAPAYPTAPGGPPSQQQEAAAMPAYMQAEDVQPAAGYAPRPQAYAGQGLGSMQADMMKLGERLERVERALLRLDRRMQLVERNELSRMGEGQTSEAQPQTYGMDGQPAPAMASDMQAPSYGNNVQPVAAQGGNEGGITSALQAAPGAPASGYLPVTASATQAGGAGGGLPSLADPEPSMGRASAGQPQPDLAIWTVRYQPSKIWPDRAELPGSRDVVQALLQGNSSGKSLTLFARGNKPTSIAFRDRVKALSRYLSKVSSRDSVPIATLAAPHLDEDTIEIFASP